MCLRNVTTLYRFVWLQIHDSRQTDKNSVSSSKVRLEREGFHLRFCMGSLYNLSCRVANAVRAYPESECPEANETQQELCPPQLHWVGQPFICNHHSYSFFLSCLYLCMCLICENLDYLIFFTFPPIFIIHPRGNSLATFLLNVNRMNFKLFAEVCLIILWPVRFPKLIFCRWAQKN